jgi:hypothetical protein
MRIRQTSRGARLGLLLVGLTLGGLVAPVTTQAQSAAGAPTEDSWDAVYLAGSKVGYVHTFVEPVKDRGRELLRVRIDIVLSYKRLNDRVTTRMQYGTIEALDGSVLRLDTRIQASDLEMRIHGDVIGGRMNLIFDGTGQRQQQSIAWSDDVRGPYAAEQSFSRKPMKPGETRSLKMYMPDLNKICDITLSSKAMEDVKLGGGTARTLLKVEQTTKLDGKPRPEFDVTLWVDAGGQVLKSLTENLGGMVTYRTTREGAMAAAAAAAPFDQILNSVIKVTHKIPRPETTRDITYRVTLKSEDPAQVLAVDRRQSVKPGSKEHESLLVVRTAGPNDGEAGPATIDDVFLRPNAMITSRDNRVIELARKAVAGATDPWVKATRIEKWVSRNIRDKNFAVAFAPASEVAQNLSGDCTEHGVLTAAMCRAAGVPARVVVGLVYADRLGGFGFHLWNEVYVNRRWVAIDASFEQDDVDAVHIKLSDSSLDGVAPFETFLPIVRVLGKMSIDPIEIR